MNLLSPLKKLLGGVEQRAANTYNNTLGNFTGNIGPFPKSTLGNDTNLNAFYNYQPPSHLQAPQQLPSFNSYRPAPVGSSRPQPFMVTQQYLNRFLPVNQQLQPFGAQGEDAYTQTQALQPVNYNAPQTSLNGQFTQGPMNSFYRLTGR